ncbi:ABC transporter permease [Chelatococcus reniformis]|uniref:ABC transporter permease n=1 Tax=Chelatococcus reniformis TaxID=1494448 RepID=A0A916TYQ5_9HYPH|nr:ABC transporter permease [Chelatococcus reniformis]GGC53005.1 ABC transporter permease [Chelatococcus reniformis]
MTAHYLEAARGRESPDVAPSAPLKVKAFGRAFVRSRALGWSAVLALLVVWQVVATVRTMPELPPLDAIAVEWLDQVENGELLSALLETLRITAIGFVIATLVGVALGFLMGRVRVVWALAEPVVELARQIPVSALLPLLILYLGIEDRLRVTVVVIVATFPILLNAFAGARSLSRTMRLTAQTFRLTWWQTQVEIGIPAALPFILVGMRQALGMTLVMAVVTGMLAGNSGVGYFILQAQQVLNVRALFAGIFTIAIVGYALNALFLLLDRRLTRWRTLGAADD